MILPSTYEVSGELSYITNEPIAFGGFTSDVYKGYNGHENVCIKRLRTTSRGGQTFFEQVSHPHNLRPEHYVLTNPGGSFQGGSDLETPQPPEHCVVQGCHL